MEEQIEKKEKILNSITDNYKKVEDTVVKNYEKIETSVVNGYTKIEDKFVSKYLVHDGETVEEAKTRLKKEQENLKYKEEK